MRWLLLPFRFCLFFPLYALFGSLRWLTRDYDRFVKLGSKIFVLSFVAWFMTAMSGYRLTIYFPPDIPFWWWIVFVMCFWCALGWMLSTRPIQWVFGGIADYCKAAILPRKKTKPQKQVAPPPPIKAPPPKEYIAAVATHGVATRGTVSDATEQLSPSLRQLITSS